MNIIHVTIVYALPDIQYIYPVQIQLNSTVKDAILYSNILKKIKILSLHHLNIGIYNKLVNLNFKIQNGDRIEIYRNLIIDPKERRRKKLLNV